MVAIKYMVLIGLACVSGLIVADAVILTVAGVSTGFTDALITIVWGV